MAQKTLQVDESGSPVTHDNPLDVGGVQVTDIQCLLEEIRDLMELNNELLKGILQ